MLCYIPREYMYLDILHVFYTYPKGVQYTYLMRFLDVTLDTYQDTSAHQDTCIFMDSSSRYIKIHRDTKSRYMYLGRVLTTLQDTIRIQSGYMRDPCGIHAGSNESMRDTCICRGSRIHKGYMRDTSKIHKGIHVSQILKFIQGLEIHPGRK